MKKNSQKVAKKRPRIPRFGPPGLRFPALDGGGTVNLPVLEAAEVTGSSVRTINRWRRDRRIPTGPLRLLQLYHAGLLVPPAWRQVGARFTAAGELVVGQYVFVRGELEGYGTMLQALRALQQEEREIRKQVTPIKLVAAA